MSGRVSRRRRNERAEREGEKLSREIGRKRESASEWSCHYARHLLADTHPRGSSPSLLSLSAKRAWILGSDLHLYHSFLLCHYLFLYSPCSFHLFHTPFLSSKTETRKSFRTGKNSKLLCSCVCACVCCILGSWCLPYAFLLYVWMLLFLPWTFCVDVKLTSGFRSWEV